MSSDDDFFDSGDLSSFSGESDIGESMSEDLSGFEDIEMCAQLQNDIEHVKQSFGETAIHVKGPIVHTVDVTLFLEDIPLSSQTAKAWRVDTCEPIIIHLKGIGASGYMHDHAPRVEVFQSHNENMGIGSQLTFVVGQFTKKQFDQQRDTYFKSRTAADQNKPENELELALLDMGFNKTQSFVASEECDNIQQAIQYLIDNPNPRRSKRLMKNKKRKTEKNDESCITINEPESGDENFQPNYQHGFLCEILRYIRYRIPTLNKYCVICDQTHLFGGSLLKPSVCRRELCAFTFQQFNIVSDAELATHQEVVDLLVSMAKAAANSNRSQQILSPFPTVFDPGSVRQQIVLDPDNPDYDLAKKLLNKIKVPCTDQLHKDPLAFSLLQWIVNSNRTHLIKLPSEYHIDVMDTPFQYIMLSAPPEQEAKFQKLKQTYGSKFAFHGSRVENWYSILRNGLRNASGTKLQLNGAAYGNGIYLATHASTSFGYSLRGGGYGGGMSNNIQIHSEDTIQDGRWICLALCEVADSDCIKKSGGIWVVPDENCVVTRFFFVFKDGRYSNRACNASTVSGPFATQIKRAMKCIE